MTQTLLFKCCCCEGEGGPTVCPSCSCCKSANKSTPQKLTITPPLIDLCCRPKVITWRITITEAVGDCTALNGVRDVTRIGEDPLISVCNYDGPSFPSCNRTGTDASMEFSRLKVLSFSELDKLVVQIEALTGGPGGPLDTVFHYVKSKACTSGHLFLASTTGVIPPRIASAITNLSVFAEPIYETPPIQESCKTCADLKFSKLTWTSGSCTWTSSQFDFCGSKVYWEVTNNCSPIYLRLKKDNGTILAVWQNDSNCPNGGNQFNLMTGITDCSWPAILTVTGSDLARCYACGECCDENPVPTELLCTLQADYCKGATSPLVYGPAFPSFKLTYDFGAEQAGCAPDYLFSMGAWTGTFVEPRGGAVVIVVLTCCKNLDPADGSRFWRLVSGCGFDSAPVQTLSPCDPFRLRFTVPSGHSCCVPDPAPADDAFTILITEVP